MKCSGPSRPKEGVELRLELEKEDEEPGSVPRKTSSNCSS